MDTIGHFYNHLFTELAHDIERVTPDDTYLDTLESHEIILGTLPQDLQKTLTLYLRYQRVHEAVYAAHHTDTNISHLQQIYASRNRQGVLYHLFWDGVRAQFGSHAHPSTVRKGWALVELDAHAIRAPYDYPGMLLIDAHTNHTSCIHHQ